MKVEALGCMRVPRGKRCGGAGSWHELVHVLVLVLVLGWQGAGAARGGVSSWLWQSSTCCPALGVHRTSHGTCKQARRVARLLSRGGKAVALHWCEPGGGGRRRVSSSRKHGRKKGAEAGRGGAALSGHTGHLRGCPLMWRTRPYVQPWGVALPGGLASCSSPEAGTPMSGGDVRHRADVEHETPNACQCEPWCPTGAEPCPRSGFLVLL